MPTDAAEHVKTNAENNRIGMPRGITTILVATDLSVRSDRASDCAIERALGLTRTHEGRVLILQVVDDNLPESIQDQTAAAAKNDISQFVIRFGSQANQRP